MKYIIILMQLFILFPLATVASFEIPKYHPGYEAWWFYGIVLFSSIAVSITITHLYDSKEV